MKRRRSPKRGLLFVVSAPSGCGKTTICKRLTSIFPRLTNSISVTTRPPRDNEKDGRDYCFVSRDRFLKMRKKGAFLEWAGNFGYFYGTPRGPVEKTLRGGRDMLLAIDVKGAAKVKKKVPESIHIFLRPPSISDLRARLKKRGTDNLGQMRRRLKIASREIARAKRYDYIVVNDSLNKAVKRVKSILQSEKKKRDC